jgi:hypothetical protein
MQGNRLLVFFSSLLQSANKYVLKFRNGIDVRVTKNFMAYTFTILKTVSTIMFNTLFLN